MKRRIFFQKKEMIIRYFLAFVLVMFFGVSQNEIMGQNGSWTAPASADNNKNPYLGNEKAILAGKNIYAQFCAICHGKKGKGNGVAGMALKPRPADFTKDFIQQQTDGAIYWKLTEGKAPMAGYKDLLTEEQRWQLVNYIRSLKK